MPVLPRSLLLLLGAVQTPQLPPTPAELELEVLANVRNQPLGDGTVDDLALPEEFLRRVADRIVRSSYEERYRIVVEDPVTPAPPETADPPPRTRWIVPTVVGVAVLGAVAAAIVRRRGARSP